MSNSTQSCPFWYRDDVTTCGRHLYLDTAVPLITGVVSLVFLLIKSIIKYYKIYARSSRVELHGENRPLLANTESYDSIEHDRLASTESDQSVKDRHFSIFKIRPTNKDGSASGEFQLIHKSTSEKLRVSFEELLVLFEVGLSVACFYYPQLISEWKRSDYTTLIRLAFWTYAFALSTIRVVNMKQVNVSLPNLWAHSTALYFFNFFPALLTFRSVLIHENSVEVKYFYIAHFIISTILFYLNFSAKIGDKPAKIYISTDCETPSYESATSIFKLITYSFLDPMIWKAYKSPLTKDDIWGLRYDDYSLFVLQGFEAAKTTSRFTVKIFTHFKLLFAIQAFWAFCESFMIFVPSLLLKTILEYVDNPTLYPANLAWFFVCCLPLIKIVDSLSSGQSLYMGRRVCARMRAIIIGQVYAKALRRRVVNTESKKEEGEVKDAKVPATDSSSEDSDSSEEPESAELGAIINLMAVDAFKVSEICGYLHFFVSSILMIIICIYLLYNLLGWSALVGSVIIFILLPVNYKFTAIGGQYQKKMLGVTDKRIQKLNETFQSIRIIKFFAWENRFFDQIMEVRKEELDLLKMRTWLWTAGALIWFLTPTLITFVSFYCYTIIQGRPLTAPIAFTSLSLFNLLRSPLDQLAGMTSFVIQSKVSLDRVEKFLNEKETDKYEQLSQERSADSPEIGFENANFSWNSTSATDFKLKDLNVAFKEGKLNVIIGPTGSGKTSLLMALLGEMELTNGKVFLPGIVPRDELVVDPETGFTESVAYCSQSAWLLNDTIRNNITFSSEFIQERYDAVVEACGLKRDFEILAGGDATEIGEKGITLSGGQKQRVSLARALYSDSKTVLLDDCLSAVDSHTALWIYENCISGPLMDGRTCILVSHNVALTVQQAEWIIVMENGRVKNQGTPEILLEAGDLGEDELIKTSVMNSRSQSRVQSSANLVGLAEKNEAMASKAAKVDEKLKKIAAEQSPEENPDDNKKTDGKLVEEETKAEGVVGFDVYRAYGRIFGGWGTWTALLSVYVASQIIYIFQSWWLRNWSMHAGISADSANSVSIATANNGIDITQLPVINYITGFTQLAYTRAKEQQFMIFGKKDEHSTEYYIYIYTAIGIFYSLVACARLIFSYFGGIRASNRIFKRVLQRVLRARLRFFDATPQGRIMNRFSKDIESVDQELVPFAEGAVMTLIECASTIVLIAIITPGFLFFAVIISFSYYLVGVFYVTLSRELKRFESVTKSPIHQHFSETLVGISTIRAYGDERRFLKENLSHIDNNNKPFFYLWVANRWLSFRVDVVGSMVMFFAGIFVLLRLDYLDAGLAGLSLSYAIAFSENALWVVRLYANIEMNMNSVERLQEYLDIEQEAPEYIPETEPRASWPEKGEIQVKDVSLRYAPHLPRVIKNVTFDVEATSKIGIVGRTGAGKSTIITAFFRFLDPETGTINIDGVDITKIGLRSLRQAITIIPQDPTLFSGTIRSNLDPFEQYSDIQMFEALRRVNLISEDDNALEVDGENQNKFLNLDNPIVEGGSNLSQGQRQLVCLARSLLRAPKVILLDEATASIDYKSDALIQQTIREAFSTSTILTIAHRLRSIIDYDKILVMDAGRVVEYEDPYKLIADNTSLFYSMCENSGELEILTQLAKEAFLIRKNSTLAS